MPPSPPAAPSITVDATPLVVPSPQPQSPAASSRSRSLSPPSSPPPGITSTISPRSSAVFAARPSPVVPASPSFSRPSSPRPSHSLHRDTQKCSTDEPASPTREGPHPPLSRPLSRAGSQADFSHIFERDVEFASTHHITPSEAVDVAIPPVLDEAAVALSAPEELTPSDVASIVRESEDVGSGWAPVPISTTSHPTFSSALQSRSPGRSGTSRSFSPDSSSRAASPGSSTSLSVGTPSPPPSSALHPSPPQNLSDALFDSEHLSHLLPHPLPLPEDLTGKRKVHLFLGHHGGSPVPFPPSSVTSAELHSLPASPSIDALNDPAATAPTTAARRLSFMSLADVINQERLDELTGSPVGVNSVPSRTMSASSSGPGAGALDVSDLKAALSPPPSQH